MAARIDTSITTTVEIEGETFTVKTLTAREQNAVNVLAVRAGDILKGYGEDDNVDADVMEGVMGVQYEILVAGLSDDPDLIAPRLWKTLVSEVMKANRLAGDDVKNSQSA